MDKQEKTFSYLFLKTWYTLLSVTPHSKRVSINKNTERPGSKIIVMGITLAKLYFMKPIFQGFPFVQEKIGFFS